MTASGAWYGPRGSEPARSEPGLARRTRALIVTGEAIAAAVLGGVVVGGALGWGIVCVAVAVAAAVLATERAGWLTVGTGRRAVDADDLVAKLRVHGVQSRSSGDVGVVGDGQGYAAGLELDVGKGMVFDLAALCSAAAEDPSRPAAVQVRLTTYAPPAPGTGMLRRAHGSAIAVHRRLHVMVRLEPAWASDVVASHGGGAKGSRAALVAAVDRLAARLRRAGIPSRVVDTAALNTLLAEDTAPELRARVFTVDLGSRPDLDRLVGLVQYAGAERAILSVSVDLASSDQWQSFAALLVGGRDAAQTDAAGAAALADAAVVGVAPASAISTVLPLGGGPGDLASVLTLARI